MKKENLSPFSPENRKRIRILFALTGIAILAACGGDGTKTAGATETQHAADTATKAHFLFEEQQEALFGTPTPDATKDSEAYKEQKDLFSLTGTAAANLAETQEAMRTDAANMGDMSATQQQLNRIYEEMDKMIQGTVFPFSTPTPTP